MKERTELKTAIVDGPITPELFSRLESMGFEIVDMNDALAMEGLRRRLEIEGIMQKVHDATGLLMIDLRHELSKLEQSFERPKIVDLLPIIIEALPSDPIQPTIIKKDNSKFFDNVPGYSRCGRARNQNFSQHFKHG